MKKGMLVFTVSALCLVLITSLAFAAQDPIPRNSLGQAETSTDNTIYLPIQLRNYHPKFFQVGFVTDTAGIDDQSFNTTIWNGVLRAQDHFGISAEYLESTDADQFEPNLTQFASHGYDLVIASSFFLGDALVNVSAQFPDINFTIVDYTYPECIPNVQPQIFKTDQAAFLAGYLASGMTKTGKIGWFGAIQMSPVTIFGVGFQAGMEHYNLEHSSNIELLVWDSATGDGLYTFWIPGLCVASPGTKSLFNEGADIFMPIGGMIGALGFDVARTRGGYGIWVDMDGYNILPGARDVMLTSVMKNLDNTTYGLIKATKDGNFNGCGVYLGDVANEGVGIAPYHDLDSAVPAALKSEIEVLKAEIASGVITDTGCISYPSHCPGGLY